MRYTYELHPGEFFLERKVGEGSWTGLSRDNDLEVCLTRYAYQLEIQTPGTTVRLVDCKGKIVKENSI